MTGQAKAVVALGVATGLMMGVALGLGARLFGRLEMKDREHRAWPLTPMTIAKRDLPAGHVVTPDDVDQRSIPEQIAAEGLIKPSDVSYVINQPLNAPVVAGQPLEWSFFDVGEPELREPIARAACEAAMTARVGPPRIESLEQIQARLVGER